jgi:hypothetical protein
VTSRRRQPAGSSLAALLLLLVAAVVIGVATGLPVAASCAESPSPSPYAFEGVVTQVRSDGRVATVRTDSGDVVQVIGGETDANQSSSVDRQYAVGGRYEFHPTNAKSPYQDNACTATRQLSGPAYDPSMNADGSSWFGKGWFIGAVFIALLLAVPWLVRRFRGHHRPGPAPEQPPSVV